MKTVPLTLTLGEAAHLELLLSQLAPHADWRFRRPLYERLAGVLEQGLVKQGAVKNEDGWLWPTS